MKRKTRKIYVTPLTLMLMVILLLLPITVHAKGNYLYEGFLDLSSTNWTSYSPGLNFNMTGGSSGVLYHGDILNVIDIQTNYKGNLVAYCYSHRLDKKVYVSVKYITKVLDTTAPTDALNTSEKAALTLDVIPEGVYRISPKCSPNSSLDVTDWGYDNETPLQIWKSEANASNQLWYVRKDTNGYYTFTSVWSNKLLDVKNGSTNLETPIQLFEKNNTEAQQWKIISTKHGYQIISKLSGLALDVKGGKSTDGTRLQVYHNNGTNAQLFDFYPVFINNPSIYLKQEGSNTCSLSAATMVLRKYAEIQGRDFTNITESSVRKVAWNKGLYNTFKYKGVKMTCKSISSLSTKEKEEHLKSMLIEHPEGVVIYNKKPSSGNPHAIVLVDYNEKDGFMVADPAGRTENGVIPISESSKVTRAIKNITTIWYVSK